MTPLALLADPVLPTDALPVTAISAVMVAIGLLGIVVPVLPGLLLCWGGVLVWAWTTGGAVGWTALAVATLILILGTVIKYLIPGRNMRQAGVPWSTLALGSVGGIIGFFVIPILGFFVGFVLGIYCAELLRTDGRSQAWPRTVAALKGVGVSMLIELISGLLIATTLAVAIVAA